MNAIETDVLTIIGENTSSPDVFLDTSAGLAQIRQSVNDAIQQMCMVSGSYRRVYLLPLRDGAIVYKLLQGYQDYFGYIVGAWDRAKKRRLTQTTATKLARADSAWMKRDGDPMQYFHVGFSYVGIHPKPSDDGAIIELECVMIPKEYLHDTGPIRLRDNFKRGAASFAVSEFYASRGDAPRAGQYWTDYLEVAGMMRLKPVMPERQWQLGGRYGYRGANGDVQR